MTPTIRSRRTLRLAVGAAIALVLAACTPAAETPVAPATPVASAAWTSLVNDWIESDMAANPSAAFYLGREEYAGVVPDWSEAGLTAEIARLHEWKARAEAMDPATLDEAQKFEREYLIAVIDGTLFWRETADWPHKNPTWYGLDPGVYLDRPYADLPKRMADYSKWASNIPAAAAQIKANLKGPLPKAYVDIALHTFKPTAEFLKADVPTVFASVTDAALQAEFKKQNAAAVAAFMDLDKHFAGLRKTQVEDFAMGADLFAKMLYANERVDAPLAELQRIGEADLKRNQEAMAKECAIYAPGKTIIECVAIEESHKPEGGDFVGYARKQLVDLRQFVIDHNVVTVPGEEEAMVKQSPPYQSQNGAYIDPSPPFAKNLPAFYNIAAPDPTWSKEKQLAYIPGKANLLFTSIHEVWPGHFLQFLHSNRSNSMFGKVYVGYAFAEGWAHYAEEMMWDEGLGDGDPEVHIGQLYNATLRNVRFLSAIGMHTNGMTLAQSKQMFIDAGYQSEGTAEQQAARGAYDPAYLNYTMGKLMIRKLRDDWCAARPELVKDGDAKTCWKPFHDAFLAFGGPPVPLVRGAMMGTAPAAVF
jgi:uncharacterized protein (DUF885 family)